MESINCIICNTDDTHLLVKKNSFNVVKCNGCGLVYLNPRLVEAELAALYDVSPALIDKKISVGKRYTGHDAHKVKKFQIAINLLKRHKKSIQNVFDLGCSTGIFLELAAKEGWTPYGSDVNHNMVEKNRRIYGEHVKLQKGHKIDFPDCFFDVVTLFDSIEHMPAPIVTIKEAARILKDDGLLVVSTPNVDGLFPRLTYNLLCKTIGAWEHPTTPGHVFQFSPATLKKVLKKAGLKWVDYNDFAIHKAYTVGELENSIINAFKEMSKKTPDNKLDNQTKRKEKICKTNPITAQSLSLKSIPRLLIRCLSWGLIVTIYPLAQLLGKGDSMLVIAGNHNTQLETRNSQRKIT